MEREMKEREREFNKTQMTEQGIIHNSAIDIPKRKDKEDLTESSEVQEQFPYLFVKMLNSL